MASHLVNYGATLDLWDERNPNVVLRMTAEAAKALREFLQENNVGEVPGGVLWRDVYRPLCETEGQIKGHFTRMMGRKAREAEEAMAMAAEYRSLCE